MSIQEIPNLERISELKRIEQKAVPNTFVNGIEAVAVQPLSVSITQSER